MNSDLRKTLNKILLEEQKFFQTKLNNHTFTITRTVIGRLLWPQKVSRKRFLLSMSLN